ncbi:MAG: DUF1611 domain-containing protein [bacterium]|nr:DUF1611 domain-containing protein [bacterium]
MSDTALVLANGMFRSVFAKTTHGLVRGPSRYPLAGIIDAEHAGEDAGELLDGRRRDIPIHASVGEALASADPRPTVCIVGVATIGGVLPPAVHAGLVEAAEAGMSLVNGLHRLLSDDPELAGIVDRNGSRIIDIRKPRPTSELRFWSGEVLRLATPRVAVLGTDCALGKRTTTSLLRGACREAGIRAEMVYTGQTGWLQGYPHGFIFDATPNDFVCGELEGAILGCQRDTDPDLILIEGQAALRNPSGPCGSEHIISGATAGVILQHAPGRKYFEDYGELGCEIPPVSEEIELIRLLGSQVWAVTLHDEGLREDDIEPTRARMAEELGLPVVHPLRGGMPRLVEVVRGHLQQARHDEVRS